MGLIDNDNRARSPEFLAALKMAAVAKARAVLAETAPRADSKILALAVLREPDRYAAKFGAPLATDTAISAVPPNVPRNRAGEDTGNGWSYAVPDVLLVPALEAQWATLVAVEASEPIRPFAPYEVK